MAVDAAERFRKEMSHLGFDDEEMFEFFRKNCEKNSIETLSFAKIG